MNEERINELSEDYVKDWFKEPLVQSRAKIDYKMGYIQSQCDTVEEIKRICLYDSTAIGASAECFLEVMPTLIDTIDKHSLGVFLRGVVYRSYTKGKDDANKAHESKVKEVVNYCNKDMDYMWAATVVGTLLGCDFKDAYKEAEKYLKEKDKDQ